MATLREYYNTGDSAYDNIAGSATPPQDLGQTFTASASYIMTSVKVKLYLIGGDLSDIILSIYNTSGGLPTGAALTTSTKDASLITTDSAGAWYEFVLDSSVEISNGVQYAIGINYAGGYDGAHCLRWRNIQAGAYDGGTGLYSTAGPTWHTYAADQMFETWGEDISSSSSSSFSSSSSSSSFSSSSSSSFSSSSSSNIILIDSYSESNQDSTGIVSNSVGQSFTNSNSVILNSCKFYLKKFGSPTGNAVAKIYVHSGTYGTSSVPTGSALATSNNFDVSTLTTNLQLITFNFSGAEKIQLNGSNYYCLLINYTGGDGSNYIISGSDISSPSHGGNQFYGSEGNWTAQSGVDMIFYVYGEEGSISSSSSSFSSSSSSFSSSSFSFSSSSSSSISSFSSSSSSTFTPWLHEYYNTGNDTALSVGGSEWRAQSFTAASSHLTTSVKLLIGRNGSNIGTVYAKIYSTDGEGKPTGSPLCSGSVNGNTLPLWSSPDWIEFSLVPSINISNGVKYAIVLSAPSATSDWIEWSMDQTSPSYTGGNMLYSFDSGSTWTNETSIDCMFEVWGAGFSSVSSSSSSYSSSSSSYSSSSNSFSSSSSSSTQTFEYQQIFYPDAHPEITSVDGYVGRIGVDQTFSDIRTGAGNTSDDSGSGIFVYLKASTTNNQFAELKRALLLFDTFSLPDNCNITSAILSIYASSASSGLGSVDLHIGSASPGVDTSLSDGDYGSCGIISFGNISYGSWGTGYKNITLNSDGINAISKIGVTKFSAQLSWDIGNSFDGIWSSGAESGFTFYAADAGVSFRPYLTVNYTTTSSSSSFSSCSSSFSSSSSSFSSSSSSFSSSSFSSCSSSFSSSSESSVSISSSSFSSSSSSFSSSSSSFSSSSFSSSSSSFSSSSFSSSSESFSSSSSSYSSSSYSSSSFSSYSITPERKIVVKLYDKDNVYKRILNEALYDISIEKTLYYGSGPISITLNTKVDDLATDITLNSKIKIYFKNKWNQSPVPVYYGYIISIDPFIQSGEERTSITCLGVSSKLKNDFLAQADEYLAFEVENKRIDLHIKEILANYRNSINDTYGDYDPCMIDNPDNYWTDTNYIESTSAIGNIPYRYFTSKHLDAIQEIAKFLPKNQSGGEYFYYYINDTDSNSDRARFILKKLSTTANHRLQINKHITSLSMRKNIEELVNTVYFWNEEGTSRDKVLMTATDSVSQQTYDKIADRITDSKVSTYTQANLFAQARLKEAKDEKAEITITVSDINYDILSFKLGDVVNIRDTKKGTDLYPDNILIIQKIILTPREAILELSKPRPDLSTQVESDREYIDRQLTWFGNIMTRIDASHLTPGGLHWITDDIVFSSDSISQISWIGNDNTSVGTFKLPNDIYRVILGGNTGTMGSDTYLYVDEKNVWCGKDIGLTPGHYTGVTPTGTPSGTGSVKVGENVLIDSTKNWKKDQWKGYALWMNPGSIPEKHIIAQSYPTQLIVEGHDPFNTTDASCAYEVHPLVLRKTTKLNKTGVAADSGSTTTLRDSDLTEADNFWNGYEMKILSGDNIGLTRTITGFTASNDTLTFAALPYAITAGIFYELYLSPETQILIATGVPTAEPTQKAEVIPNVSAIFDSSYLNAVDHIVQRSVTADLIKANTITANEINTEGMNIGDFGGNLDDIDDGSVYKKTTTNEKTGADRAYNSLNASYLYTKSIVNTDLSPRGAPSTGIRIDSSGIYGFKSGSTTFYINSSGDAYFKGTIGASIIESSTYRTNSSGNNRLQILSPGYGNYITWWNSLNNLQSFIIDDFSKHLLIYAPTGGYVEIGPFLNVQGNIYVTGTVDGVDIYNFATNYNTHIANISAHHSSTSNGIAITPASVNAGSGAIGTIGWLRGGKLYGDTGAANFKIADMDISNQLKMAVGLNMNNQNISGTNTLGFQATTSSPGSPGQIKYYDYGGKQQFRGNAGGVIGYIILATPL